MLAETTRTWQITTSGFVAPNRAQSLITAKRSPTRRPTAVAVFTRGEQRGRENNDTQMKGPNNAVATCSNRSCGACYRVATAWPDAGSAYVFDLSTAPLLGDLDGSGESDLRDLATLLAHFGRLPGMTVADGDVDDDGDVDISDLTLFLEDFGRTCP